ncbi:MAG TPA: OmpA family protein [Oligoflexus sp.]|uniref:OmpA family protein n=1 Tax=Oligoflexus sp. TaxID=1971216 RepID=UPI002D321EB6|nr:OmpA family protein [Oligoflexus sp.]HYX38403.1 OmpA family protein [Oligoflexus sp.]
MKLMHASILSICLLVSAACAHEPAVQEISATAIPADEVSKFEQELAQAVTDQIDVLAPTNYAKAKEELKDAKEDVKDHDKAKDILRQVAVGRAYLAKARDFAKVAQGNMNEVVEARRLAVQEKAPDAFPAEFKDADDDLKNVTADIEDNKTEAAARDRTKILAQYLDLEVRAIRRTALNDAEGRVNKAKKDGAEAWAPQSLAGAEKSIKDADNFIIANRHETAKIKELSQQALAAADKLLLINKEARNGTKATGEQAALKLFAEREKNSQQQSELAAANTRLNQANTQLNQAKAQNTAAEAALASGQSFNQKFENAQTQFTKSEAEVYRQGDNLVIRLKGLEFNNAKATLKGSNFPLLAKVKNVIGDMKADSVTVEGHTDSVGSEAKNIELSQARAEAVKSYLESNSASGAAVRYSAAGFGFQKPIATNKTPAGRAQNRRVDVVIHTQAANM